MPALIAVSAAATGERVGAAAWMGVGAATLGAALIAGRPGGGGLAARYRALHRLAAPVPRLALRHPGGGRSAPAGRRRLRQPGLGGGAAARAGLRPARAAAPFALASGLGRYRGAGPAFHRRRHPVLAGSARRGCPPPRPAVFINVEPVVGTGLGVLLFADRPSWLAALGGGLILAGSLIVVLFERRSGEWRARRRGRAHPRVSVGGRGASRIVQARFRPPALCRTASKGETR